MHPGFTRLGIHNIDDINFCVTHVSTVSDMQDKKNKKTIGKHKATYQSPEVLMNEWYFKLLIANSIITLNCEHKNQFCNRSSKKAMYKLTM